MKIAIVSKLWEETSPYATGGTGVSIGYLVDGLVKRGHKVTLFATGNSRTKAQKLISVRKYPYQGDYSEIHEYQNIAAAFKRHKNFDLIHCAVEQKSVLFGSLVSTPSLHSIRYGEFFDHEEELLKEYKNLNFIGNSKSLKKILPFLNWRGFVYNGIDTSLFKLEEKKDDYLLFLGRLSPQKGPDIAIRVAKKLKKKLILAGRISDTDRNFLEKKVFPFIDGKQIIYVGEAPFKKKVKLFEKAEAFLHPIDYFEACSNTLLEAQACGTPVVAFDMGSNKELIEHGKTGFIVKTEREMVEAVKKIDKIDKKFCRTRVEKYFSIDKMVENYEKLYKKIITT